jgi:hypothetical protein
MSLPLLETTFRRLVEELKRSNDQAVAAAASRLADELEATAESLVAAHARQSQFVHGVGSLYVAKTSNPGQYPRWSEITDKPANLDQLESEDGAGPAFTMDAIRIDASQVISGVFPYFRIPLADHNESDYFKAVRGSDPRLQTRSMGLVTTEPLAGGDFVSPDGRYPSGVIRRADASRFQDGFVVGFVVEPYGAGDIAAVFPHGLNRIHIPNEGTNDVIGRTVFVSGMPGRAAFTMHPPPGWVQPVGYVQRVVNTMTVDVIVRYDYRLWNETAL